LREGACGSSEPSGQSQLPDLLGEVTTRSNFSACSLMAGRVRVPPSPPPVRTRTTLVSRSLRAVRETACTALTRTWRCTSRAIAPSRATCSLLVRPPPTARRVLPSSWAGWDGEATRLRAPSDALVATACAGLNRGLAGSAPLGCGLLRKGLRGRRPLGAGPLRMAGTASGGGLRRKHATPTPGPRGASTSGQLVQVPGADVDDERPTSNLHAHRLGRGLAAPVAHDHHCLCRASPPK
jgi:hypothetical protein